MNRILYSPITKAVAVILCIACITAGVLVITDGILRTDSEEHFIYRWENSFEESEYIQELLSAPQYAIMEAYYTAYRTELNSAAEGDSTPVTSEPEGESAPTDGISQEPPDVASYIREELNRLYYGDKIDYFVEWNGQIFTNCNAATPEDVLDGDPIYSLIQWKENGASVSTSTHYGDALDLLNYISRYDTASTLTLCVSVKDAYAAECEALWERQAAVVTETVALGSLLALGALLQMVYLACVCGKNKRGEQKIVWVDYIWSEIHLVVSAGAVIGGAALYIFLLEEALYTHFPTRLLYPLAALLAALTAGILLTSLLSIIRSIKARRGVDASLILSSIRLLWRWLVRGCRWISRACKAGQSALVRILSKKAGVLAVTALLAYTLVLLFGVFAIEVFWDGASVLLWLAAVTIAFVLACWALVKRALDLDEIHRGVRSMQDGHVSHRIPTPQSRELIPLATSINSVAEGLDKAVADKVKAERMKAELITNVSHDLKTPLTSIINYTELLSQVEGLPEEARDYVAILAKKNLRLKNLTQDLFDISKVQSGNEEVVWEKLDVALLIEQALAEQDGEIRASELPFCVETPKELYILADGRKMSRVVGNLLSNILKYAMPHTRVFITAAVKDGEVTAEFKNISAHPLQMDPEELTGRFVRGDESRTTEGSGLGLAIAKSYTELCGGRLDITLDGDLFKVILTFPVCPADK